MIAQLLARLSQYRVWRYALPVLAAVICATLATTAVGNLTFLTNANQFVEDWEVAALAPVEPQDSDIVIAAVTEDTLANFPYRSPVDRAFMADLLTALGQKGPRAIGIDFLFDQPTEPEKDTALTRALAGLKVPVRVAYTESPNIVSPQQKDYLSHYVPRDKRALVNIAEDQFDVVRWVYPGAVTQDGRYVMGFSRSLAEAAGIKTPRDQVPIRWHGKPDAKTDAFREFPAHAVKFLPGDWFKNKIVLIGSDITLVDRHRTPYTTLYSGGEGMLPGVVIQAHALSQLLNNRASPEVSWGMELAVALGLGLLGAVLGLASWRVALRMVLAVLCVLAFWAGGAGLFHAGGPLLGLVSPSLSFALSFFAMEAASGSEARAQRKFIEGVFSHHVAKEVLQQIIKDPARMTSLEGERRVMTFLFTDIANFTTTSEGMDSRELARMLNAYLEGMTEIVQKHGGMVDKFIGDAVVAIFNAPIDLPDHAGAAVRCALEMDEFSAAFSKEQKAKGINFGNTRIGVHTGTAVVGNFGSKSRHNYTASGDAVNTAARLEGLNKHFGTRMSVSGATQSLCTNVRFRPTASVVLKGKTQAIEVWEPLRPDDPRGSFITRYCAAYDMLKEGAPEAGPLIEDLAREAPNDPCVAFLLRHIRQGETGVTVVMAEK